MAWTDTTSTAETWYRQQTGTTVWDGGDTQWDLSGNVYLTQWDIPADSYTEDTSPSETWVDI